MGLTNEMLIQRMRLATAKAGNDQEKLSSIENKFAGEVFRFFAGQYLKSIKGPEVRVYDYKESEKFFNARLYPKNSLTGDYRTDSSIFPHAIVIDDQTERVKEVYCISSSNKAMWVDRVLEKYKRDIKYFPNVFDDGCRLFLVTTSDGVLETKVDGVTKITAPITGAEFGAIVDKLWSSKIRKR